jgi:hypothetical protein
MNISESLQFYTPYELCMLSTHQNLAFGDKELPTICQPMILRMLWLMRQSATITITMLCDMNLPGLGHNIATLSVML